MLVVAYALAVVIAIKRRKDHPVLFNVFVPIAAMSLVVIYNPPLYSFITAHFEDQEGANSIYGRLCALWFVFPIIVGACVMIVGYIEKKKGRINLFIILALLAMAVVRKDDSYRPLNMHTDPYYKMTDTAIEICEGITESEQGEIPVLILEQEDIIAKILEDNGEEYYTYNDITDMMQVYSGRIKQHTERIDNGGKVIDLNGIKPYRYVICFADENTNQKMQDSGLKTVYKKGFVSLMRE